MISAPRQQRAQGACADSPYCQPAAPLLDALALQPRTGWCWLHLGPIGPRTTPFTTHGPAAQTVAAVCKFGGGGDMLATVSRRGMSTGSISAGGSIFSV